MSTSQNYKNNNKNIYKYSTTTSNNNNSNNNDNENDGDKNYYIDQHLNKIKNGFNVNNMIETLVSQKSNCGILNLSTANKTNNNSNTINNMNNNINNTMNSNMLNSNMNNGINNPITNSITSSIKMKSGLSLVLPSATNTFNTSKKDMETGRKTELVTFLLIYLII